MPTARCFAILRLRPCPCAQLAVLGLALVASAGGQTQLREDDAKAVLGAPASTLPLAEPAIGDLDGNGWFDLVLEGPRFFHNDRGRFTEVTPPGLGAMPALRSKCLLVDLDGDADLDLVRNAPTIEVYRNTGAGAFANATSALGMPLNGFVAFDLEAADLERDGDSDLFVAGPSGLLLFENQGTAMREVSASRLPAVAAPYFAAVVDADGDGDTDLGTAGRIPDLAPAVALVLADVDRDGDLDYATGGDADPFRSASTENRLYLNDGAGTFTHAPGRMPADRDITDDLAAADADGDGDLDLFLANRVDIAGLFGEDRLLRNDGTGRFANAPATQIAATNRDTNELALFDADGDGDTDLYRASLTGGSYQQLLRNDGTGWFATAPGLLPPLPGPVVRSVAAERRGGCTCCSTTAPRTTPTLRRRASAAPSRPTSWRSCCWPKTSTMTAIRSCWSVATAAWRCTRTSIAPCAAAPCRRRGSTTGSRSRSNPAMPPPRRWCCRSSPTAARGCRCRPSASSASTWRGRWRCRC